ncbi:MAG TPA: hypothetical protein VK689_12815 [Armatimonadota bacterium]|nr:hypothetical protein [Armatimonadota bacterium]
MSVEARQLLIRLAQRRQQPGSGSSLTLLRERTAVRRWPDLKEVLGDIPWAVVGGVATRRYMPERNTLDLDIIIARSDAGRVSRRFRSGGYHYSGALAVGGETWRSADGTEIDVLFAKEAWLLDGLARAEGNPDAQGLPVLPLPQLTLMKLRSGRVQDIADVSRMLGAASADELDAVRSLFLREEPESLEDVESLIQLGGLEYT